MHTVVSGADDLPRSIPVVKMYDRVTAAFPGVLLPAAMKLLGERNWYLPRSLRWLPEAHDPEPAPAQG